MGGDGASAKARRRDLAQCASAAGSAVEAHDIAAQVGSHTATESFAIIKDLAEAMQQIQVARETGDSVIGSAEAIRTGGT